MRSRIISFTEHPLFEQHLRRLSNEELILRFEYNISAEQIEEYVDNIRAEDIIIGLFSSSKIIGAAHLSPVNKNLSFGGSVELGLSVESEYQNLGLGTELFNASIATCEAQRATELIVRCQVENTAMVRIVQKFNGKVNTSSGECYAQIALNQHSDKVKKDNSFGLDYLKTSVFFSI